jgi:hypothetical protein
VAPPAQAVGSNGEAAPVEKELELLSLAYASIARRMGLSLAEAQARILAELERAGLT